MEFIICKISKYLILIFMALYVLNCFTYFTAGSKRKRTSYLNRQVWYIFLIHLLCHVTLYLNTKSIKVVYYYLIEIVIAVGFIIFFHLAYRNASRLITNNIAFLMLIGYTMLYRLSPKLADKQFILASAGLILSSFIPYILTRIQKLKDYTVFYAVFGLIFLISVFIPHVGVVVNGSRNWINILGLGIQPMEFVKIIFIFYVASSLYKLETINELVINGIVSAAFMLVLAAQKDFGAMLIFYICYIMMVYLATSRPIFMIGGILLLVCGVAGIYLIFKDTAFLSHIIIRVQAWRDPFKFQDTGGYQVAESLFAIGTGGLAGSGLGKGMPYMIPVAESDFIFAAICEELGVIFGLSLMLIYISSFIAIMNIAMKIKEAFYKYMTFGIGICYIVQVFLNIGGVIKFIPSTGVTLPLVSYGLSSVFSTLIMMMCVQHTYILVSKEASYVEEEKERILADGV